MKMSVYRQGQPLETVDHLECVRLSIDRENSEMVMHARLTQATVLVALESGQAVIKAYQPNDEAHRFEDFYDTAVSLSDYRKMERQNVKSRDELAPHLYELELFLTQERPISIRLRVKCKDQHEVKAMIKRLVREDIQFGTELYSKFAIALMETERGSIEAGGALRILDAAPDDAPDWEFVDR